MFVQALAAEWAWPWSMGRISKRDCRSFQEFASSAFMTVPVLRLSDAEAETAFCVVASLAALEREGVRLENSEPTGLPNFGAVLRGLSPCRYEHVAREEYNHRGRYRSQANVNLNRLKTALVIFGIYRPDSPVCPLPQNQYPDQAWKAMSQRR